MKRGFHIILFLLACQAGWSQEQYSPETLKRIHAVENGLGRRIKIIGERDHTITERMKFYKIKGVSIAVVHNYKVEWAKGYGWADEEEKRPVTTATLFEPGSISKSLNAVGVLKLVQDKKLDLYTDINNYLTSWKFPYDSVSKNRKITLAQLLSHSAGLSVHGFAGYERGTAIPTLPQVLDGKAPANSPAVRSEFEPGLKSQYSGGGTTISQQIICDVTQQAYDVFMYENVLKPMGMIHSFYTQPAPEEKQSLCATGYYSDGSPVAGKFHVYPEQAAAGLWMTPTDLCNYIIETQLSYEGKSSKVLTPEMTKLRVTPYNDESAALGVFVEKRNGATYFQHGAGNEGFCGQYFGTLGGGDGVVVFVNSQNPGILDEIINSVAAAYNWRDFYNPVYKKAIKAPEALLRAATGIYVYEDQWASILRKDDGYYLYAEDIYSKIYFSSDSDFFNIEFPTEKRIIRDKKGVVTGYAQKANGNELPAAVKVGNPDTLHLDKVQLNYIGWHLLENKRASEAIPYLKRALAISPDDLLSLGNLAHSYLFTGNYNGALDIYKAHLKEQIDTNFTWADMIKQDFVFFKRNGYDTAGMSRIFADLKISKPKNF